MVFRDEWGLSFSDICPIVEEKPQKKSQPGKLTRPVIEPGPATSVNDVTPRLQLLASKFMCTRYVADKKLIIL